MDYKEKNYNIAGWLVLYGIVFFILFIALVVYVYNRNFDQLL